MWMYEKRLQYPVNIKNPDPKMAQFIMSQYGGPDGEIGASMRYLSQRYAMPYDTCKAVLTDIGTEELAHMEIVAAIIHQLTRNLTPEQIVEAGFGPYYIDHTTGIWPQAAGGVPFNACEFQSKGDVITDLVEDMAAEQKARTTYDNILRVVKDPDVCDPIRYLREREIVHFQRFGEALRITQDHLDSRTFYAFNPAFDQVRGSQPENGTEHQPQVPPSVITPPRTVPRRERRRCSSPAERPEAGRWRAEKTARSPALRSPEAGRRRETGCSSGTGQCPAGRPPELRREMSCSRR